MKLWFWITGVLTSFRSHVDFQLRPRCETGKISHQMRPSVSRKRYFTVNGSFLFTICCWTHLKNSNKPYSMKKWSHFSLLSYADVSLFSISSFHWWLLTAWHNLPHSSNTSETTDHSFRSSVIVDIYRYFRTQHTCNFYWPKWISYCLWIKFEGACLFFSFAI